MGIEVTTKKPENYTQQTRMKNLFRSLIKPTPPSSSQLLSQLLSKQQNGHLPYLPPQPSPITSNTNTNNNPSTSFSYEDEYQFIKDVDHNKHSQLTPPPSVSSFLKQWRLTESHYMKTTSQLRTWIHGELDRLHDGSSDDLSNHFLLQNMSIYPGHCYYFSIFDPELVIVRLELLLPMNDGKCDGRCMDDEETWMKNQIIGNHDAIENKILTAYKQLLTKRDANGGSRSVRGDVECGSVIDIEFSANGDSGGAVAAKLRLVYDKNHLIQQLKRRWMAGGKKDHVTMPTDAISISPDQTLIAYKYKFGSDRIIEIVHIETQRVIDRIKTKQMVSNMEFSQDSKTIFYTIENESHRPHRVLAHVIGCDRTQRDKLLLDEPDESFFLELYRSKDGKCLFINSGNRATSECFIINEHDYQVQLLKRRKPGELFFPEHHNGSIYVVSNCDNATNLQLIKLEPAGCYNPDHMHYSVIVPARADTKIDDIEVFEDYIVLYEKRYGLDQIRIVEMKDEQYTNHVVNVPECSNIHHLINRRFSSKLLLVNLDSIIHHEKLHLVNLEDKTLEPIVFSNSEANDIANSNFIVTQTKVQSTNSPVQIPLVIAHRKNLELNGNNPCLVLGYGAYGHPTDLSFEIQKLLLLHNGFIIAFPQVRGGGDGDINWHKNGSLLNKRNSFNDFNDCVRFLIDQRYTNPSLVCAKGVSAGGMLVATSSILHPELYRSILLKVPFLDVTTTMLDKTLPLTELESDEWGDPTCDKAVFDYIQSYSPYGQLLATKNVSQLPHMYISVALKDFHVPSWQVFKYVARLTRLMREGNAGTPLVVCKILDEAGHGDEAGKNGTNEDIASEYAFIFASLGIQPKAIKASET